MTRTAPRATTRTLMILATAITTMMIAACADTTGPAHDCVGGVTQGTGTCFP